MLIPPCLERIFSTTNTEFFNQLKNYISLVFFSTILFHIFFYSSAELWRVRKNNFFYNFSFLIHHLMVIFSCLFSDYIVIYTFFFYCNNVCTLKNIYISHKFPWKLAFLIKFDIFNTIASCKQSDQKKNVFLIPTKCILSVLIFLTSLFLI